MKRLLALGLCLLAFGCSRRDVVEDHHDDSEHSDTALGISFHPKSGLSVAPSTAKFINLKVEDVRERTVRESVCFTARVFRTATDHGLDLGRNAIASAFVPAEKTALLTNNQRAIVRWEGRSLNASVSHVNRALERVQDQAEVTVQIFNANDGLTNQTVIDVVVPLERDQNVVIIPKSALLRTIEGNFVYTESGNRFVRSAVKINSVQGETVEVVEGLYSGDRVVAQPVMTLWLAELQSVRGGKSCADD